MKNQIFVDLYGYCKGELLVREFTKKYFNEICLRDIPDFRLLENVVGTKNKYNKLNQADENYDTDVVKMLWKSVDEIIKIQKEIQL